MTGHAWFLICVLVVSIVVLIALINSRMKFHPFAALIVVALAAGVATGMSAPDIASSIEDGAGGILGDVGLTLAFGTMLGRLMADSGAVEQIATVLVDRSSTRALPLMMTIAAFVIGIPMFFEVGLIVLLPLVFSVAEAVRRERPDVRSPYVLLVIPTVAALATLHGMLPPHPGPLVAVDGLNADLGKTIIVGLVCAIPTVLLAGPVFARFMSSRVTLEPDAEIVAQFTHPVAARSASVPSGAMSARTDANPEPVDPSGGTDGHGALRRRGTRGPDAVPHHRRDRLRQGQSRPRASLRSSARQWWRCCSVSCSHCSSSPTVKGARARKSANRYQTASSPSWGS